MKRFLTLTALAGTLALGACGTLPDCSSSDLDGCGRNMAYTEERTIETDSRVAAPAPQAVVEEPAPAPEPAPEPVTAPAPAPVDTQIMTKADEPIYTKGMTK